MSGPLTEQERRDVEEACLEGFYCAGANDWRYRPSLGANAVEKVIAAIVTRHRTEAAASALREAADEWTGWWKFPLWLRARAASVEAETTGDDRE